MVDVTTSDGIALRVAANDTVLEPLPREEKRGRLRRVNEIHEIKEAIERGVYSVPASELADAILRTARRAN
jgi:anti-sigma28 factor (negative regulator of flagellin synthesis)